MNHPAEVRPSAGHSRQSDPSGQSAFYLLSCRCQNGTTTAPVGRLMVPEDVQNRVLGKLLWLLDKVREEAEDSNVRVLEDSSEVIDGVHFHGCTLWTDLGLLGDEYLAAEEVRCALRDYRKIRYGARFRRLTPDHTKGIHSSSVAWLAAALQDRSQKHVVITHHAPSVNSVPVHLKTHKLTPGYASNLESLVARLRPDLWIHGHVHHQSDYLLGTTRIVCNPRGYPDEEIAAFREDFTVTV